MVKKILRELYMLPRGEQRALLLLSMLLIVATIARITVRFLPGETPPGMEEFVKESRAIMASIEKMDSLSGVHLVTGRSPTVPVPGDQPRVISQQSQVNNPQTATTRRQSPILINSADSSELLPIPGIGPVFAGRIVKYRNLLGGFVSINQLFEVYGLTEKTIGLMIGHILIDTVAVRGIAINSSTFRDLLRHPYLQFEDVKALVQYRDFKGGITSLQEMRDNMLLSDSTLLKIGPYFLFGL